MSRASTVCRWFAPISADLISISLMYELYLILLVKVWKDVILKWKCLRCVHIKEVSLIWKFARMWQNLHLVYVRMADKEIIIKDWYAFSVCQDPRDGVCNALPNICWEYVRISDKRLWCNVDHTLVYVKILNRSLKTVFAMMLPIGRWRYKQYYRQKAKFGTEITTLLVMFKYDGVWLIK